MEKGIAESVNSDVFLGAFSFLFSPGNWFPKEVPAVVSTFFSWIFACELYVVSVRPQPPARYGSVPTDTVDRAECPLNHLVSPLPPPPSLLCYCCETGGLHQAQHHLDWGHCSFSKPPGQPGIVINISLTACNTATVPTLGFLSPFLYLYNLFSTQQPE